MNNITYEMLFTDFDANLADDSYFAKLNRAYRECQRKDNSDRTNS